MNAVLLVPPSSEPVSLAEAKAWLRIDTDDEDAVVTALIIAARATLEATTRRLFITQTWRLTFDTWPDCLITSPFGTGTSVQSTALDIALAPIASIVALRVVDGAGVPQTIDPATHQLVGTPDCAKIVFTSSPPSPGRAMAGISVDVVAGFGAASDVPQPLRQAVLMLVARWFEKRGDAVETDRSELPISVAALIAPFRRPRL